MSGQSLCCNANNCIGESFLDAHGVKKPVIDGMGMGTFKESSF